MTRRMGALLGVRPALSRDATLKIRALMAARYAVVEGRRSLRFGQVRAVSSSLDDHGFFRRPSPPATPASIADPVADPDALTAEERVAIRRKRLGPADWVIVASFFSTVAAVIVTATVAHGPAVDPDVERTRVRTAVIEHVLERVSPYVDADSSAFCVALYGSIDPGQGFLDTFDANGAPVVPSSLCHRDAPQVRGRDLFLLSVGKIRWLYGGYVQVVVGDDRRDLYTLKLRDGRWIVMRIEPAWR
jgi:hypothetical protein